MKKLLLTGLICLLVGTAYADCLTGDCPDRDRKQLASSQQCCRCEVRDSRGNLLSVGTVCSGVSVMDKCRQAGGQCTQIWSR
jgi:hypothetical protein